MIYLDNAATTLIKPPSVAMQMQRAIGRLASPGRGGHRFSMRAADIALQCREKASSFFHVPNPENVVFTFNATHALNIAIKSAVKPGDKVIISGYEHNAVVRPLHAIGAKVTIVSSELFDSEDTVRAFSNAITTDTALVICTHVSNVFGFILPIEQIALVCADRGVPLIIDASQSAGIIPIDFKRLGAFSIAMPGHKGLYGPQGTGLLLCSGKERPSCLQGGTGSNSELLDMPDFLPDMLEAGTHNMPGISGLLGGLDFVTAKGCDKIRAHEQRLVLTAAKGLESIPGVTVYYDETGKNQTGVLSFNLDGISPEIVGDELAKRDIAVRAGLHCAPLAHHTVGTDNGTVRVSVSIFNTNAEIKCFLTAVERLRHAYT